MSVQIIHTVYHKIMWNIGIHLYASHYATDSFILDIMYYTQMAISMEKKGTKSESYFFTIKYVYYEFNQHIITYIFIFWSYMGSSGATKWEFSTNIDRPI